jgi:hypothetical protein
MSFLFERTIKVERPAHQTNDAAPGAAGYGGIDAAQMSEIVASAPASVQRKGTGARNPMGLPGDATPYRWAILIPASAGIAPGVIQDRDIVTDDLGRRFQVAADYTHSLGWSLDGERLET